MRSIATVLATAMVLSACALNDDGADAPVDLAANGEAAYLKHCAGCHDDGMLGAPRIGQPQDWEDRSKLWQAVLMEHAKEGYLDMPARGGKVDLSDEVVNAAAEYMIERTFCEWPCD
jgi:cytochrome c5